MGDGLTDHLSKLTSFESTGMDACGLLVGPSGSAHDLCKKGGKLSQAEWYAEKLKTAGVKVNNSTSA